MASESLSSSTHKTARIFFLFLISFFGFISIVGTGGGGGGDGVTTYSVGGTVDGLTGTGLVLQNNGGNDLAISADGPFTFTTKLANNATYIVTVATQPGGQTCTITNGSGTIASANVTNVTVNCVTTAFSVGGNVSGLIGSGMVLQNNGGDNLAISANGAFTFATLLGNGAAYSVTVLTQPSGQTCSVTNSSGTIAAANVTNVSVSCLDLSNISGVWQGTQTYTSVSGTGCGNAVNDVTRPYFSMTQTGTTVTAVTKEGITLTGTIGSILPAAVSMSGTASITDPVNGNDVGASLDFSGTLSAGGVLSGTVTSQQTVNSVSVCDEVASFSGGFIYRHTGAENYDGLYALELDTDSGRGINMLEVDVTGSTLALYRDTGELNLTASSFDSTTGYFNADLQETRNNDDGVTSTVYHQNFRGIFVRANDDVSGLPVVSVKSVGYFEVYSGLDGTGSVTSRDYMDDSEGYGKLAALEAFMRSNYYRLSGGGYVDGIFVGVFHSPLKTSNNLYVEVLDGTTRLCTGMYDSRYSQTQYLPPVDMSTEAFQEDNYSNINCNTSDSSGVHTVIEGNTYTVRIMDTGADGIIDGSAADTEVVSTTIVATVHPSFFNSRLWPNDFVINGDQPSQTMRRGVEDGIIDLFGFVDTTEAMDLSWLTLTGAEEYQVRISGLSDRIHEVRLNTTDPAVTATIPANVLNDSDPSIIRVAAKKTDINNGAIAFSFSTYLNVTPGVNGLFNVELDQVLDPPWWAFQVYLVSDMQGNVVRCEITNNDFWICIDASVDYATNEVTLELSDGGAAGCVGTCSLVLAFTDSANGTAYSTEIAGLGQGDGATTHVRLVNPELQMRSVQRAGSPSNPIQTQVVINNAIDAVTGGVFEQAIFSADDDTNLIVGGSDTGATQRTIWDNSVTGEEWINNAGRFIVMPVDDGEGQDNGTSLDKFTGVDWSLGQGMLDAELYKAQVDTAVTGLRWVFKYDYTQPDPTALVAPLLTDITVHIGLTDVTAGVGTGDLGNPINISADPNFNLTWAGSTVTNGEWQLIFSDLDTSFQIRTEWMNAATHPDLTYDSGSGTYIWLNNGPAIPAGKTFQIHIRTRDADDTMFGIQHSSQRVYVQNP
jgi:hypothetical protein